MGQQSGIARDSQTVGGIGGGLNAKLWQVLVPGPSTAVRQTVPSKTIKWFAS